MIIGAHLPDAQKEEYIRANLVPGAVIYRFCNFTKPPKHKYLLVTQVRADTALLIINTSINSFIQRTRHLMCCQVPMDHAGHPFLDHDSFIDCSYAEYEDTSLLVRELMHDMNGLKGHITLELRKRVIQGVSDSFTMPQNEIAQLVAALTLP